MGSFLNFCELLAMALWLGSIAFFRFLTAPTLFGALDESSAAKALGALFPKYYLLGIVCGLVLVAVQVGRGVLWYWGGMIRPAIGLFTLLTLINIYARQVLPRRSVMLNAATLLSLLAYLVWMSVRGY